MTEREPRRVPLFYGRRHGRRLRAGQQALLDERLPDLAIAADGPVDPATLFPGRRRFELEIGFGGGEHLAAAAARHPDTGFVGCEAYVNGIARLLAAIEREGLDNIRIWPDDARLLLPSLPDATFARIHLLFPDPWPKARHARRRLVGAESLDAFARLLADGGELRIASDDMGYVRWTLEHAMRHPDLAWTARRPDDWRTPPPDWPGTRYERKALAAGRRPAYLVFRRCPRTA